MLLPPCYVLLPSQEETTQILIERAKLQTVLSLPRLVVAKLGSEDPLLRAETEKPQETDPEDVSEPTEAAHSLLKRCECQHSDTFACRTGLL